MMGRLLGTEVSHFFCWLRQPCAVSLPWPFAAVIAGRNSSYSCFLAVRNLLFLTLKRNLGPSPEHSIGILELPLVR